MSKRKGEAPVADAANDATGNEAQPHVVSGRHPQSQPAALAAALAYVDRVRASLEDASFDAFLVTLQAFKAGDISPGDVIARMHQLMGHDHSLLSDFAIFLPPGYELTPEEQAASGPPP